MEVTSDKMVLAHARWKIRLKSAIEGGEQIDAASAGRDDLCDLGKWMDGEGLRHAQLEAYKDLKAKHTKFHKCVADVVVRSHSCSKKSALEFIDPLKSDFARSSSDCINAIRKMWDHIGKA